MKIKNGKIRKYAKSRTLRINSLVGILGAVVMLSNDPTVMAWLSKHPQVMGYCVSAVAVVNIVLRLIRKNGSFRVKK